MEGRHHSRSCGKCSRYVLYRTESVCPVRVPLGGLKDVGYDQRVEHIRVGVVTWVR